MTHPYFHRREYIMMKIGAQLYTLRTYCQNETDLGRTLARVAAMGYEAV